VIVVAWKTRPLHVLQPMGAAVLSSDKGVAFEIVLNDGAIETTPSNADCDSALACCRHHDPGGQRLRQRRWTQDEDHDH
jgi:hypothetical protein